MCVWWFIRFYNAKSLGMLRCYCCTNITLLLENSETFVLLADTVASPSSPSSPSLCQGTGELLCWSRPAERKSYKGSPPGDPRGRGGPLHALVPWVQMFKALVLAVPEIVRWMVCGMQTGKSLFFIGKSSCLSSRKGPCSIAMLNNQG